MIVIKKEYSRNKYIRNWFNFSTLVVFLGDGLKGKSVERLSTFGEDVWPRREGGKKGKRKGRWDWEGCINLGGGESCNLDTPSRATNPNGPPPPTPSHHEKAY
jgi:hypothetical protein